MCSASWGRGLQTAHRPRRRARPPHGHPAKPLTSPHLMKVAAGVRQIQERGELIDKL